jgi:hypothetical protein
MGAEKLSRRVVVGNSTWFMMWKIGVGPTAEPGKIEAVTFFSFDKQQF